MLSPPPQKQEHVPPRSVLHMLLKNYDWNKGATYILQLFLLRYLPIDAIIIIQLGRFLVPPSLAPFADVI